MLLAKINQRESDFSVAGALHPTPEGVGGTHTNNNLQTRHRIPAVTAAREEKKTHKANKQGCSQAFSRKMKPVSPRRGFTHSSLRLKNRPERHGEESLAGVRDWSAVCELHILSARTSASLCLRGFECV